MSSMRSTRPVSRLQVTDAAAQVRWAQRNPASGKLAEALEGLAKAIRANPGHTAPIRL